MVSAPAARVPGTEVGRTKTRLPSLVTGRRLERDCRERNAVHKTREESSVAAAGGFVCCLPTFRGVWVMNAFGVWLWRQWGPVVAPSRGFQKPAEWDGQAAADRRR